MSPEAWMNAFYLHPLPDDPDDAHRVLLPEMTTALLALSRGPGTNNSSRMGTWAFLDAAHGHHNWADGRDLPRPRLRELRSYDLERGTIREPWHIDARYGAFFGSGNLRLLDAIIGLAQQDPTHPLHTAADRSLHSVAGKHPVVAAYARGAVS